MMAKKLFLIIRNYLEHEIIAFQDKKNKIEI